MIIDLSNLFIINLSHYPLNDDISTVVGLVNGPQSKIISLKPCQCVGFEFWETLDEPLIVTLDSSGTTIYLVLVLAA